MAYNHGVRILENPTALVAPIMGSAGLQVIFGTAPINLVDDPYHATNVPMLCNSYAEAVESVGFSYDFKNYTLCQSIDASFRVCNVYPIILINILDPKKHKKDIEAKEYAVSDGQATVNVTGLLLDKLVVKNGETELKADADYTAVFDNDGYVVVTLIQKTSTEGALIPLPAKISVAGTAIDPTQVDYKDVIGGYNASTNETTGIELISQIFPKFGMTPGLLLAPGWSQNPEVAATLAAKCLNINGVFTCECIVDIDSTSETGATKYSDVKTVKEKSGVTSNHTLAVWPKCTVGTKVYYASAIFGAVTEQSDAENDNVPYVSPSNKPVSITGLCLDDEDNTEVVLDEQKANFVNSFGVATFTPWNGFRTWGNNTAGYPGTTDPKDRWFCVRRFFSWWGNSFILTFHQKVDSPMNKKLIQTICDTWNITGNFYVAQGKVAGARIEFREEDNPITNLINGRIQFYQHLAPFPPAEDILNVLEFDPDMLTDALFG